MQRHNLILCALIRAVDWMDNSTRQKAIVSAAARDDDKKLTIFMFPVAKGQSGGNHVVHRLSGRASERHESRRALSKRKALISTRVTLIAASFIRSSNFPRTAISTTCKTCGSGPRIMHSISSESQI